VWGGGRGVKDLAYIKVASGVGAGLVISGRIYRGPGGTAGEIGHITLDESGPARRLAGRHRARHRRQQAPRTPHPGGRRHLERRSPRRRR
ncbi:ROK family protein, partial [Streptomyces albidoflavus]